ncbi:MAG: biotin--[acetyl-CoA-carboxylase] ligase [Proteobacteria bacterium]|nr:biotin--[acetyl-CoA-carboxylase] ligase [Pseudomonadota bacterium]
MNRFLVTSVLGRPALEFHETIDSTNLRARELALAGGQEGTLVAAERQTQGRGRLGRAWHSPPGLNLYFSLILRPPLSPEHTTCLTLAAGLGAAEAIERITKRRPDIKWPNDLLISGRKICGILSEMEVRAGRADFVILGLGLNVNLGPEHLPPEIASLAGSLLIATGRPWDRAQLLAALLNGIEGAYFDLVRGRRAAILSRYREHCVTLGSMVEVAQGTTRRRGRAVDIDESGGLIVESLDDGRRITVDAGEVTLIKPTPLENP